ncbi:tripartite tricarboxylate transporter substrate-binding protein [Variovorax saccharolyticus]|uniref:tripartite tricarboxylate transporter substrate-binding protein n=1 Tax=Variovorax saccharolyticus TaxID=3053516 RepID=UPI0025783C3A|nr:tripartite tricarboxylate transporter substrate-binding protein [Variovorax sp. J31P216]MDM0027698.1 tripartite tricarboxylate transporter substrate-binding protein [Variovorax sp. J31P216]
MSTPLTRRSVTAAAAGLALAAALPVRAQQRVIRIVVPFGTGAVQDTVARAFNNELGVALNASAIVENRAGAGGTVGAAIVAKAPPDGNTLVLAAASHHIAGFLYSKLPYDPLKDFVGVANLGNAGYVLAVAADLDVANTADFIKLVKANPGKYNYASAGNGSATHLAMASFLAKAGLQMTHIPTKSTGEAVNEVLAGRVQAVISSSIGVIGFQNDARMKLLASTGQTRSPFLPALPTVAESGLPGYAFDSWIGLLAPAGTPKAEVDRLNAATNKVLADPAIQERFKRLGVEPRSQSAEEFQKLLRADWDAMGAVVKASGAKVD